MNNIIPTIANCVVRDIHGRVLLLRRSIHLQQAGYYCLPGGMIEAGETAATAVLRELEEETGIKCIPQDLSKTGSYVIDDAGRQRGVQLFTCYVTDEVSIVLDPHEADGYCWADSKLLGEIDLLPGLRDVLRSKVFNGDKDV